MEREVCLEVVFSTTANRILLKKPNSNGKKHRPLRVEISSIESRDHLTGPVFISLYTSSEKGRKICEGSDVYFCLFDKKTSRILPIVLGEDFAVIGFPATESLPSTTPIWIGIEAYGGDISGRIRFTYLSGC